MDFLVSICRHVRRPRLPWRTIREFIAGALLAPTLLTFFWMIVFGNTAIHMELFGEGGGAGAVAESVPTALFVMLEKLPWPQFSSIIATLLVGTYFVTSSDSGSLVIDILTAEGDPDPPVGQRIFWALTEGAVAAVLLMAGGLAALQTAAITTAAPFSVIMVIMCFSLLRGLRTEPARAARLRLREEKVVGALQERLARLREKTVEDWRGRLKEIAEGKRLTQRRKVMPPLEDARARIRTFIDETVVPAFEDLEEELSGLGRETAIERGKTRAALVVFHEGEEEFACAVRGHAVRKMTFAFPEVGEGMPPVFLAEVILRDSAVREDVMEKFTRDRIIADFLAEYAKWKGW